MSKYCIRLDRPMPEIAEGVQIMTGCKIYGVHHNCEGCPNLVEMGDDTSYSCNSNDDINPYNI